MGLFKCNSRVLTADIDYQDPPLSSLPFSLFCSRLPFVHQQRMTRLWFGGVDEQVGVPDLFRLLAEYGKVSAIVIRTNYAFADIECDDEEAAISALHGLKFHGTELTVESAKSTQNAAISRHVSVFVVGLPAGTALSEIQETVASSATEAPQNSSLHDMPSYESGKEESEGESKTDKWTDTSIAEFEFESEEAARACCDALADATFPGEDSYAFIGTRLADTRRAKPYRPDMALPFPVQLLVRPALVGAIIGRGGANIRDLAQKSRARVELERRDAHGPTPGRRIFIEGTLNHSVDAFRSLVQLMGENDAEMNAEGAEGPYVTSIQMFVPGDMVGHLIGRSGSNIKHVIESSGAVVELIPLQYPAHAPPFRLVKLEGNTRQLTHAFALILRKFAAAMKHGMDYARNPAVIGMMQMPGVPAPFMPAPFGGVVAQPPEVMTVHVPAWSVGALIGRSGSNIRQMVQESQADIRIQSPPEGSPETEPRDCVVRGTTEQQIRAQTLIWRRLQEDQRRPPMDPATDNFHVSFRIPAAKVGRVIGRGGASIKELKRASGARVDVVPNEDQAGEATVSVSGPFHLVQSALSMLRPIIHAN
eukprot:m.15550 g.15550  ORF g.15550 m.15550 type:complete len:592 (+) comp7871_c0_seq2:84-1859(+)